GGTTECRRRPRPGGELRLRPRLDHPPGIRTRPEELLSLARSQGGFTEASRAKNRIRSRVPGGDSAGGDDCRAAVFGATVGGGDFLKARGSEEWRSHRPQARLRCRV